MDIRYCIIKIKMKLGKAVSKKQMSYYNEKNVEKLRQMGMKIGQGTFFYDVVPHIDVQRPWMIEIGEYCKITTGVIILQHDYSRSVLRRAYGPIIAEAKKTVIGNNVFIGMNAIILMGAHIGNNVIIGAGSVVSGKIPDNVVVAGNPARVIRSLEEHYIKRKKCYIDEARECAEEYYRVYGRKPSIADMGAFFPLYLKKDRNLLEKNKIDVMLSGDDSEEAIKHWLDSEDIYNSFEEFLDSCNF